MSAATPVSASVIIPAYTLDRWRLLSEAVDSVVAQTRPPLELILCIDHNAELLERSTQQWANDGRSPFPIRVVANRFEQDELGSGVHVKAHGSRRRFGAGWARNTGAELAKGDVLVFLDDDARAEPDWLEHLLGPYSDPHTVAVGGPPLPDYETARPPWFPRTFDWVFGCAYEGLPESPAPIRHLIGANMSVRRDAFEAIGGFHSIDFDDLDMCMRVAALAEGNRLMYEPRAVVHHFVPADRVSWRYFWRRCFFVNREKVEAFREMGEAANLRAEREHVMTAVLRDVVAQLRSIGRGEMVGVLRLAAMTVGLVAAAAGHLVGRAQAVQADRRVVVAGPRS